MKKTLLVVSTLLFSVMSVNEDAYALSKIRNMFNRNKDQDSITMDKAASGFKKAYKALQDISSNTDTYNYKNFSGEDAIDILVTYRLFTKICADFFSWLYTLTDAIVTGYNSLQKANVSSEKAKSQRASEKAADKQMASKDKIQNAINCLTGTGMRAIMAYVKASAIIYMKMITGVEFSNANIDTIKKNSASLKKELVELSGTLDSFVDIFERMSEENSDLEIDLDKIQEIKDTAVLVSDIMRQIDRYFNSGEQASEKDYDDLIKDCDLNNNKKNSNKSKALRNKTKIANQEEEEDYQDSYKDRERQGDNRSSSRTRRDDEKDYSLKNRGDKFDRDNDDDRLSDKSSRSRQKDDKYYDDDEKSSSDAKSRSKYKNEGDDDDNIIRRSRARA